ncbi:MAG: hypothetical protein BroJett040_05210 [Oligoflexia bacterium]|nr:MAG: hypothetical protein BroJett040_05210 [Oligoflexia bacterium]
MMNAIQNMIATSLTLMGLSTATIGEMNYDVVEQGKVTPTIYYIETINEDINSCDESEKRDLHGAQGVVLLKVCKKTLKICGLQGSCTVITNGETYRLNILDQVMGQDRFFVIPENGCVFGYGVNSICLDPYHTVAADLRLYKPGDVIFMPDLVGLKLPDGQVHSGFLVVRDEGRGIVGSGRFDFFSGEMRWTDPNNPFVKMKLDDERTRLNYYKIKGDLAQAIIQARAFPLIPLR